MFLDHVLFTLAHSDIRLGYQFISEGQGASSEGYILCFPELNYLGGKTVPVQHKAVHLPPKTIVLPPKYVLLTPYAVLRQPKTLLQPPKTVLLISKTVFLIHKTKL